MKYSARLVAALAALAVVAVVVIALVAVFATTPDTDTATAASMQSTGIHALPEGGGTALVLTSFDAAPETAAPVAVTTIDLPTLHEGGGSYMVAAQFDTAIQDDLNVARASAAPLAITTIAMLAVLAVMRGGVAFFYSSVSTLTHWFVGLTRIMKRATTLFAYVSGAGRTTRTTMPMHITQHRHVAAVETHTTDDGETKNGFRRWLQRTIPLFTGFRRVQRA